VSKRRSPQVPGTFGDRLARLIAVATEHAEPGRLYVQPVAHDDGCPALRTQSFRDCRCEPVFAPPARLDTGGSEEAR
jgi:hypothetical protein